MLRHGGLVLRELESGTGYVDVSIALSKVLHLVEMKVMRGRLQGVEQLAVYMKQEQRSAGWLVVLDARSPALKKAIAEQIETVAGIVRTIVIDINPSAPSRQGKAS